jgi:hypothetical protein
VLIFVVSNTFVRDRNLFLDKVGAWNRLESIKASELVLVVGFWFLLLHLLDQINGIRIFLRRLFLLRHRNWHTKRNIIKSYWWSGIGIDLAHHSPLSVRV